MSVIVAIGVAALEWIFKHTFQIAIVALLWSIAGNIKLLRVEASSYLYDSRRRLGNEGYDEDDDDDFVP